MESKPVTKAGDRKAERRLLRLFTSEQLVEAVIRRHAANRAAVKLLSDALAIIARRRHGLDYGCVVWDTKVYSFTSTQAAVVKLLWEAMEAGAPDVRQETLIEAAGSEAESLRDLFKNHPAWNVLVVSGPARGLYRLAV